MDIERAYAMGVDDMQQAIVVACTVLPEPGEAKVIIDGSAYSQSWRVLPRGEEVFQTECGWGELANVQMAYEEGLDYGEQNNVAPDDCAIYWEDGMLWIERADSDGNFDSDREGS